MAAPSIVGTTSVVDNGIQGTTSFSDSHALPDSGGSAQNRVALLAVCYDTDTSPTTLSSVDYGGETCTALVNNDRTASGVAVFYLLESSLANLTEGNSYTFSGSSDQDLDNYNTVVMVLENADQTPANWDTTSATSANDNTPSTSITVSNADSILVDFIKGSRGSETWTKDASQTEIWNSSPTIKGGGAGSYKDVSSGSTSMDWSSDDSLTDPTHALVAIQYDPPTIELTQDSTASFTPVFNGGTLTHGLTQSSVASFAPVYYTHEITDAELIQTSTATFTPVFNGGTLELALTQSSTASFSPTFPTHTISLTLVQAEVATFTPEFYRSSITGFTRITPNNEGFTQVTPNTEGFTKVR